MRLPYPRPKGLTHAEEIERNRQIEMADKQNHKRGQDVEIGEGRLILTDVATGTRYDVYIDNGALSVAEIGGGIVPSDALRLAELEIQGTYGDTVSVVAKSKTLLKFGRNADLGTSTETVWEYGGDETYVTTNAIDTVSSSDASDTATVMFVEGHTVSGTGTSSQFTFTTQTVTLNGQNKVTLTTPLARVSRAYVQSGTLAGDFYVYEDDTLTGGVPNTAANVHITVMGASGQTQSFKAATTFSNVDYFICTGGYASITKKTAGVADFQLEVRAPGGVFRPAGGRITLDSDATTIAQVEFNPPVIVPKNADIRVRATGSTTGIEVDASFQGYLALVQ